MATKLTSSYQYIGRTSGVSCANGWNFYVLLYAKTSGSVSTGKHNVSVKMRLVCDKDSTFYGYYTDGSVTVGGVSAIFWDGQQVPNAAWNTTSITEGGVTYPRWIDLKEGTAVIDTKFAEKDVTIAASWSRNSISGTPPKWLPYTTVITASITVTLPSIASASVPTVSASSVQMGKEVTITTNRVNSSLTHKLTYSVGGSTGTIATDVGASYKWKVPDLVSKIPNYTSKTCTITCETYSGSTLIGTKSVPLTLTVPSATTPTLSASSAVMKGNVTITTPRNSSSFTHDLTYTFGGSTVSIATGVTSSYAWTIPDLVSKIPNKASDTCTITCTTKNGTATVGTKTVTLTLTVPAKSTPTVSASTVKMGTSVTITTNRNSTGYTHTLSYKIGNTTGTIATGVTSSKEWTPPKSLAASTGNKLSATCTITCDTYNGTHKVGTATKDITLNVPDATKPKLSKTSIVLGESVTISTPREADCYEHLLSYTLKANGSEEIAFENTFDITVETSFDWTPVAKTLAKAIPSATGGTITLSCATRFKGSTTVIGTQPVKLNVTVPNNSTTQPNATMSVSAVDTPFSGVYVAGHSKVKVSYSASSDYSTIKSYSTKVLSYSGDTNPHTSQVLSNAGTVKITGKVTDARGYYTTVTKDITVIDYGRPRIIPYSGKNSIVCARCNSDGTIDPGGVYLRIQIGRHYSKVVSNSTQKNFCKLSYQWKTDGQSDSEYSTAVELLAKTATSDYVSKTLSGIVTSNTTAYNIKLIAEDDVGNTDTVIITIPTAFATWHVPAGGHGFTLGGYHDPSKKDVFDCLFDAEFEGHVSGKVLGLGKLPRIPANDDLDAYKEAGVYAITSNSIAETLNLPEGKCGTLRVWSGIGLGNTTGDDVFVIQEYIPYNNIKSWRRAFFCMNDQWTYGKWKYIQFTEVD